MAERYVPSPEEIARAEGMLTDEQREMSAVRERYFLQEIDHWFDTHLDADLERRQPTPEEAEGMERKLDALADAMHGSPARWLLDGALNISLYRGAWLGVHKDVDISVYAEDLAAFEAHLAGKGYGLFLSRETAEGKKMLERTDAVGIAEGAGHPLVARIDGQGRRVPGDLSFIDLHLLRRNEAGEETFWRGALPKEWLLPRPFPRPDGAMVNASHPARTAFYKLHQGRRYDRTDLRALAASGQLSPGDLDDIERMVMTGDAGVEAFFRETAAALHPRLREGMTAAEVRNAFLADPVLAQGVERDPARALQAQAFCADVARDFPSDPEALAGRFSRAFGLQEVSMRLQDGIRELRAALPSQG